MISTPLLTHSIPYHQNIFKKKKPQTDALFSCSFGENSCLLHALACQVGHNVMHSQTESFCVIPSPLVDCNYRLHTYDVYRSADASWWRPGCTLEQCAKSRSPLPPHVRFRPLCVSNFFVRSDPLEFLIFSRGSLIMLSVYIWGKKTNKKKSTFHMDSFIENFTTYHDVATGVVKSLSMA